jgi:hypothetical protein
MGLHATGATVTPRRRRLQTSPECDSETHRTPFFSNTSSPRANFFLTVERFVMGRARQ